MIKHLEDNAVLKGFSSNRLDNLAKALYGQLKESGFKRKLVVVPSYTLKRYLTDALMKLSPQQVSLGIEWALFSGCLQKILGSSLFSSNIGACALRCLIWEKFQNIATEPLYEPLYRAIASQNGISDKRLTWVSQELADLFSLLQQHEGTVFEKWIAQEGWKQDLWKVLFAKRDPVFKLLENVASPAFKGEIHLFGLDALPQVLFRFFKRLSQTQKVYFYHFSPTKEYWGDYRSDRKEKQLLHLLQKKGASKGELESLRGYLKEDHPLLKNWGEHGQALNRLFFEGDIFLDELYEENPSQTLLGQVQNQCLHLEAENFLSIEENTISISIERCPSKWREVEVLYHRLIQFFQATPNCQPSDVLVLAPDISVYAPFIQAVFRQRGSPFDFRVEGVAQIKKNPALDTLSLLFSLIRNRWEKEDLAQIFSSKPFLKALRFTYEEGLVIQGWIEEMKISCGFDFEHYRELIRAKEPLEETKRTWKEALHGLIDGLVFPTTFAQILKQEEIEGSSGFTIPEQVVDFSEAELLGRFTQAIGSLFDDIQVFRKEEKTLDEWALFLECFIDSYIEVDKDSREKKTLWECVDSLRSVFLFLGRKSSSLPFFLLLPHMDFFFHSKNGAIYAESHNAIQFASLTCGNILPAKILCMIGLGEESFPREDSFQAEDPLLKEMGLVLPKKSVEDRYGFLKGLLSAKTHLLLSYSAFSEKDHKPIGPSLAMRDLLDFLDRRFAIDGKKPSQTIETVHAPFPFHEVYFRKEGKEKNFSEQDYLAFKALYKEKGDAFRTLAPEFYVSKEIERSEPVSNVERVDIKHFSQLARDPFAFYLNHSLQLYLKREDENEEESEFAINALQRYLLRKAALHQRPEALLNTLRKTTLLPTGLFKKIAERDLLEQFNALKSSMQDFGLDAKDLMIFNFEPDCIAPYKKNVQNWVLPALQVEDGEKRYLIHGELSHVSCEGLVILAKKSFEEIAKHWPSFLLLHFLPKEFPVKPQMLFLQSKAAEALHLSSPRQSLVDYLRYYQMGLSGLSPFYPSLAQNLLFEKKQEWVKSLKTFLKRDRYRYLTWVLRDVERPPLALFENWVPSLKNIFYPLIGEPHET